MEIAPHISLDITSELGIPVITGTRIAITVVVGALAGGMTKEEVMQENAITMEQLEAVLAYSADLVGKTWHIPPVLHGLIPKRYEHCAIENYYPQGQQNSQEFLLQVKAVLDCKSYVREYPNIGFGLLFAGPCGVGKTHLATSVIKELSNRVNAQCVFYDYSDLLKKIRDGYKLHNNSAAKVLSNVYDAEVLLLDNLGVMNPSVWVLQATSDIISARYNDNKITILTTNFLDKSRDNIQTLENVIGVRVRSLLCEMCKYVEIYGDDYRRQALIRKANKF